MRASHASPASSSSSSSSAAAIQGSTQVAKSSEEEIDEQIHEQEQLLLVAKSSHTVATTTTTTRSAVRSSAADANEDEDVHRHEDQTGDVSVSVHQLPLMPPLTLVPATKPAATVRSTVGEVANELEVKISALQEQLQQLQSEMQQQKQKPTKQVSHGEVPQVMKVKREPATVSAAANVASSSVRNLTSHHHASDDHDSDGEEDEEENSERFRERHDESIIQQIQQEEEEDEENNPYVSYNAWLKRREEMYPYRENNKCYRNRYTLLNENGRILEYYRFGMMVGFPVSLYLSQFNRYYKRQMYEAGLDNTASSVRGVDSRSLTVPLFFYDTRDRVISPHTRARRMMISPLTVMFYMNYLNRCVHIHLM